MVREAENRTPVGNYYLTNELHCSTISENDVYSILSFKEILNKDVKAAEIPRDTWADLLEQNGFSRSGAENMVLMTNAVISGKTQVQYDITHTGISFQDYIRRELGQD